MFPINIFAEENLFTVKKDGLRITLTSTYSDPPSHVIRHSRIEVPYNGL